eukprot:COSAG02_NODE_57658_length_280_cov_0.569061_1_plen_27_part_01
MYAGESVIKHCVNGGATGETNTLHLRF